MVKEKLITNNESLNNSSFYSQNRKVVLELTEIIRASTYDCTTQIEAASVHLLDCKEYIFKTSKS